MTKLIKIFGAREHNLKNINCEFPKNQLVVFTGVSGSGKSSLAFHTLYAEGRRRYIESLSAYARQFLGGNEKSKVDRIEGLAPAIAINQKTISHNTRSTVGTTTEIYDFLRLLYARIGHPTCVNGHGRITSISLQQILTTINNSFPAPTQVVILAPRVVNRKGSFRDLFVKLQQEHFLRVRVDGVIYSLDQTIKLDKNYRHNIDIVIDQITLADDEAVASRLHDAVEIALAHGDQLVRVVDVTTKRETLFSASHACTVCGFKISNLEPRLFSFNAPLGACHDCKGLGVRLNVDLQKLVPAPQLTIDEGAVAFLGGNDRESNLDWQKFKVLLDHYHIPRGQPFAQLSDAAIKIILYGSPERIPVTLNSASGKVYRDFNFVEGLAKLIERRYHESTSERRKNLYRRYLTEETCVSCRGNRLNDEALAVKIDGLSIIEVTNLTIKVALHWFTQLKLSPYDRKVGTMIINEINNRLNFLMKVGLHYLTLSRPARSLSGGESQRIRLATQIGSRLTGVIYVLDEPSIGLHQKDNQQLIATLVELRSLGNTVVVVEHDEEMIKAADWIVDLGPQAGVAGGQIIYSGTTTQLLSTTNSLTAQYLTKQKRILVPTTRRSGTGQVIKIINAAANNLQKIKVKIPLGKLVAVTGVSGSGKSTLINEVLGKAIRQALYNNLEKPGLHERIIGINLIDRLRTITQDPIGKTPRSIPATYTSVFDDIRELFASSPESKMRGYSKSRFSFNVAGGRCETCRGAGIIEINMQFLPNLFISCEVCDGKRYNHETLMVKFRRKNIYDVLDMTFSEANVFFAKQAAIKSKIEVICAIGLGYLKLGQPSTQLSGGEAQRIKLATYLLKPLSGHTLFLMDEPTTGLHPWDIEKLVKIINHIVNGGNTVVIIEHNLDVIKMADYIIDLGPGGGLEGGQVVAHGTPEQIALNDHSFTAQFLRPLLNHC